MNDNQLKANEEEKEKNNDDLNHAAFVPELKPKEKSFQVKQKNKEKSRPKSILREILDFLYFCYEFLMLMAIII